ncbi:MAG TPA: UDP-N-acetylglucosamine 1-carboxyvinyltransferase [bacterium]|nr:UDP-N-acetylglucosamine 1-carboxyvinyltransferase [bacterium]
MDKFKIFHCNGLKGEVAISGSKNSALPIMAAAILSSGKFELDNIPSLRDIYTMKKVLEYLGAKIEYCAETKKMLIDTTCLNKTTAPYELVKTMRASAVVLGPLLTRFGKARVSLPGGCAIGARPLNIHLKGFEDLKAKINIESGYINASIKKKLIGGTVILDFPSVGATENIMMAAALAEGKTEIINAAREPEIVDLANMLNKMGARIKNAGENKIEIIGVKKLKAVKYKVIPDRIEAGTFLTAVGLIGGRIKIKNIIMEHLPVVIEKLLEIGVKIERVSKNIIIASRAKKIKATNIKTLPFPGFATDMQAQFCAMLSVAEGVSLISETVFENRFMHISELNRLGANISIDHNTAIIKGVKELSAAQIMASDLRAGAALVLAGLAARGETELLRVYHIDRGYENIELKFSKLGAHIERIKSKSFDI